MKKTLILLIIATLLLTTTTLADDVYNVNITNQPLYGNSNIVGSYVYNFTGTEANTTYRWFVNGTLVASGLSTKYKTNGTNNYITECVQGNCYHYLSNGTLLSTTAMDSSNKMASDGNYYYGLVSNYPRSFYINNYSLNTAGAVRTYGSYLVTDGTYVWVDGYNSNIYQVYANNMSIVTSTSYGADTYNIALDSNYVYVGGSSTIHMINQYYKNLTLKAQGNVTGEVHDMWSDDTYVYAGLKNGEGIVQFWVANMSRVANNSVGQTYAIMAFNGKVYAGGTNNKIVEYYAENMTATGVVSANFGASIYGLSNDGNNIYVLLSAANIYQLYSNLSTKSTWTGYSTAYRSDPIVLPTPNFTLMPTGLNAQGVGSNITLEITPSNGTANGTAINSSSIIVLNSPPIASSVNITPTTAYKNSTLTGAYTFSDVDGTADGYSFYAWFINQTLFSSGNTYSALANITGSNYSAKTVSYTYSCPQGYLDFPNWINASTKSTAGWTGGFCAGAPATWTYLYNYSIQVPSDTTILSLRQSLWVGSAAWSYTYSTSNSVYAYNFSNSAYEMVGTVTASRFGNPAGETCTIGTINITNANYFNATKHVRLSFSAYTQGYQNMNSNYASAGSCDGATITAGTANYGLINFGYTTYNSSGSINKQVLAIPALSSLSKGTNVTFQVTPNDGTSNGTAVNSSTVTISNWVPTAASVNITPTTAYKNNTLYGNYTFTDAVDSDNDGISYFRWFVNNTLNTTGRANSTNITTLTNIPKNMVVKIEITPFDGTSNGTAVNSSALTISNWAPSVSAVNITPTTAYKNSTLIGNYTYSDPVDSDAESNSYFRWFINGTVNATGRANSTNITTLTNIAKGSTIILEIKPFDGTSNGTAVNSSALTISNWPPSVSAVNITPATAYKNNTLYGNYTFADPVDGDSDSASYFKWFIDGTLNTTGRSISSNITTLISIPKNTQVLLEITPYDGTANGTAVNSSALIISNAVPTMTLVYPANGSWLDRVTSPNMNITVYDLDSDSCNVTFWNSSDMIICTQNSSISPSGTNINCTVINLTPNVQQNMYITINDGQNSINTSLRFTPNDEPKTSNFRIDTINATTIVTKWNNDPDMEWISLKVGADIIEVRNLKGNTDNNWTVNNLYASYDYDFTIQTGDNLTAMSEYYTFPFRTYGWQPAMVNNSYRQLITAPAVGTDCSDCAINLTLTEDNFNYTDWTYWVTYPAFKHLNWTNGNDLVFYDYYDSTPLLYNITYWNVPGEGGVTTQTIPDSVSTTGTWNDAAYLYDGSWSTYGVPNPSGTYYFNYTIPAGAKTTSVLRIYAGGWYWDDTIPSQCFGGTDMRFKATANYTSSNITVYCQDNSDDSWDYIWDYSSKYFYETMITWYYDCEAHITLMPKHWNDATQSNENGQDSAYDTKLYMYYGDATRPANKTSVPYSTLTTTFTLDAEEKYSPGAPAISSLLNTTISATSENISWVTDQSTDARVEYATNEYLLGTQWAWKLENTTETFQNIYADTLEEHSLEVYGNQYISIVNATCSNSTLNGNISINSATGDLPVEINFTDRNNTNNYDWNITYTQNRTYYRGTNSPNFNIEGLSPDTQYWYKVWAYGITTNSSEDGTFILGTPADTSEATFVNYSEDRPNDQITVCFNITDLDGCANVAGSIQFWNEISTDFNETSATAGLGLGVFCKTISGLSYGHNYSYRAKMACTTTGYSDEYTNELMPIQEFFAGSTITDDNDERERQYCPAGIGISPCYEQKGYREGMQVEEDWIYIETNVTNDKAKTLHWWDGTGWTTYAMTNSSYGFYYKTLTNLGSAWQTFYITDSSGTILNWTKPSMIHLETQNRTDETKYVAFNATPSNITYLQLYMDYEYYNSTAYLWCMAAPGGNLYDCMNVEYWGGARESGITAAQSGTEYDRGQLFRGAVINGMSYDTGVLNPTFTASWRPLGNGTDGTSERYCFAFTDYWINESRIPTNNITNYYARYWSKNSRWSSYMGIYQDRTYDFDTLFQWSIDSLSYTRDWSAITASKINTKNAVQTVASSVFSSAPHNQSLIIDYKTGLDIDISTNPVDYYEFGFLTDGQWTNQQINKYQRGFVIFNLPSNATLNATDTDGDGLTDYDELFVYYTDPKSTDTDGGGTNDQAEITAGSDPNIYSDDNTAPGAATFIYPATNGSNIDYAEDVNITWNASYDLENDTITYYLEYSPDDIHYAIIGVTNNTWYVWDNSELSLSDYYELRLTPYDQSVNGTQNTLHDLVLTGPSSSSQVGAGKDVATGRMFSAQVEMPTIYKIGGDNEFVFRLLDNAGTDLKNINSISATLYNPALQPIWSGNEFTPINKSYKGTFTLPIDSEYGTYSMQINATQNLSLQKYTYKFDIFANNSVIADKMLPTFSLSKTGADTAPIMKVITAFIRSDVGKFILTSLITAIIIYTTGYLRFLSKKKSRRFPQY